MDAAVVAVYQYWIAFSHKKKNLKKKQHWWLFSVETDVSLALQLTTGWLCLMWPVAPIGNLKLLLPALPGSKRNLIVCFVQSPSKFFFYPFTNVFSGLFSRWICKINLSHFGKVPSSVLGYISLPLFSAYPHVTLIYSIPPRVKGVQPAQS